MPSTLRRGFTLVELSIVLALIGIILGGGLVVFTASVQTAQFNNTVARMDTIDKMLLNYAVANSRIPCPSNLTITPGSTNYGTEAATPGTCYGGTPSASYQATSGTVEGGVPTRALELSDDYMYDSWGHRIRYAVDPAYTVKGTLPVASQCTLSSAPNTSSITVKDSTGATRSNSGAYALISHGANGHGGFTSAGVAVTAGSTNTDEQTNCHCGSSASPTTYSAGYVQKAPTLDSTTTTDNFDDIVTYKDAWELQAANFQVTATNCAFVYVADQGNFRVQKFFSGLYQLAFGTGYQGAGGTIGSDGNGNGQFGNSFGGNLSAVNVDLSGNIYAFDRNDSGNFRIQKFSSQGIYISTPVSMSYGSGNGESKSQFGFAMDSSGNFYIPDGGNYRVQKFSSSGTYLMTIGGDKGDGTHTCTQCASTTSCTCYSGSGNGQFASLGATYAALDSSGNIYVVDNGNDRIQEFNSSGGFVQNIGVPGCCGQNGQLGDALGLAFDPSGNLWVANGGSIVDEFSYSSGTWSWKATLGGTASACSSCLCTGATCPFNSGSGNGQFNTVNAISFDTNGNIYAADSGNNRVEVFNNGGTFLYSIGGPSPYSCEATPATSSPSCTAGTGSGQFNSPIATAVSGR